MITIEEMHQLLDQIVDELPAELFQQLNGGIYLLPDEKLSEDDLAEDLYVLGEYCHEYPLGRYINIYYGSFVQLDIAEKRLPKRLRDVVLHELTHHWEDLSGERGLEQKDERMVDAYRRRHLKHE